MDISLYIKILIFIILALFASWPYFEKFTEYNWTKKILIGCAIVLLNVLGTLDIIDGDTQTKKDKIELTNSAKKILDMNVQIGNLRQMISELKANEKNEFDEINKKQDDRFNALNDRLTIKLQENKGDIAQESDSTQ